VKLHWGHLGGMFAAILAGGLAGAALVTIPWAINQFPPIFLAALLIAGIHVGLIAMPLFVLALVSGARPTLPKVLVAGLLIGTLPFTLISGSLAWWAGLAGLLGSYAFWLAAGLVEPWKQV
jgi:hypothetical protein